MQISENFFWQEDLLHTFSIFSRLPLKIFLAGCTPFLHQKMRQRKLYIAPDLHIPFSAAFPEKLPDHAQSAANISWNPLGSDKKPMLHFYGKYSPFLWQMHRPALSHSTAYWTSYLLHIHSPGTGVRAVPEILCGIIFPRHRKAFRLKRIPETGILHFQASIPVRSCSPSPEESFHPIALHNYRLRYPHLPCPSHRQAFLSSSDLQDNHPNPETSVWFLWLPASHSSGQLQFLWLIRRLSESVDLSFHIQDTVQGSGLPNHFPQGSVPSLCMSVSRHFPPPLQDIFLHYAPARSLKLIFLFCQP